MWELRPHTYSNVFCEGVCVYLCVLICTFMNPQEDEWLSGAADEPLCTVLSNNHNFHLTGKWYDEKCSESGYGFVCQKPQGKLSSASLFLFFIVFLIVCLSLPVCVVFSRFVLLL